MYVIFFFNDTATTEIYTLSLHDALPIFEDKVHDARNGIRSPCCRGTAGHHIHALHENRRDRAEVDDASDIRLHDSRSEEHTSELQSRQYLVCRLLLEKKKHEQLHTTPHL